MIVTLGGFTFYSEQAQVQASASTVKFKLTDLGQWYSSPPINTTVDTIPYGDGGFQPVRSYRGPKAMSLEGVTYAADAQTAQLNSYRMIAALAGDGGSLDLVVSDESGIYAMTVWLAGSPQVLPFGPARARFQIPLVAPDPRKYRGQNPQYSLPAGAGADGLRFPLFESGYLDFGTFSPSGLTVVTNGGTAESWPMFRVRGKVGATGLTINSGDDGLTYEAAVAVGKELLLSPYAGGRATIDGVDVTGGNLTRSDWPSIKPGESRAFSFAVADGDANTQLTIQFSDAWW